MKITLTYLNTFLPLWHLPNLNTRLRTYKTLLLDIYLFVQLIKIKVLIRWPMKTAKLIILKWVLCWLRRFKPAAVFPIYYWMIKHSTYSTGHLIGCPVLLIPQFPNRVPCVFAYLKQTSSAFVAGSAKERKYIQDKLLSTASWQMLTWL